MKNESVKKTLEKSKNALEEKRGNVQSKMCINKTNTFTIIAMNFVQEQLNKEYFNQPNQQNKLFCKILLRKTEYYQTNIHIQR